MNITQDRDACVILTHDRPLSDFITLLADILSHLNDAINYDAKFWLLENNIRRTYVSFRVIRLWVSVRVRQMFATSPSTHLPNVIHFVYYLFILLLVRYGARGSVVG
jgi:hypothetical protein